MKKLLSLALALAAATVLPGSAMALDVDDCWSVAILKADRAQHVGEWFFELDDDDPAACIYSLEWVSPTALISTDCQFAELKAHGRRGCIRNSMINFPTIVTLSDACDYCEGFSDLGLLELVERVVLGEGFNRMDGLIKMTGPTGTVHSIVALSS
jgi:hypothetical protein